MVSLIRDCNPGLVFPILGFRIKDFAIPVSHRDYGIRQEYGIDRE